MKIPKELEIALRGANIQLQKKNPDVVLKLSHHSGAWECAIADKKNTDVELAVLRMGKPREMELLFGGILQN
jgi:hypothetical protein